MNDKVDGRLGSFIEESSQGELVEVSLEGAINVVDSIGLLKTRGFHLNGSRAPLCIGQSLSLRRSGSSEEPPRSISTRVGVNICDGCRSPAVVGLWCYR